MKKIKTKKWEKMKRQTYGMRERRMDGSRKKER